MLKRTFFPTALLLVGDSCAAYAPAHGQGSFGPRLQSAVENAPQIFNAVHNAMRQFGSSLHHNGMSFFQATIPTGTILYHGAGDAEIPETYEWLAFEIEHSEAFARSIRRKPKDDDEPLVFQEGSQIPLRRSLLTAHADKAGFEAHIQSPHFDAWRNKSLDLDDYIIEPGYLHVYQAARPLNVLYIDGMAAGKTYMGTNDAEDYILTGNKSRPTFEDYERVADLCNWAKDWQLDGFIRMEPGFELVYCNFQDGGLHQASATKRPNVSRSKESDMFRHFQWLRAASQRYHGIGGSRVLLDYSSMVSAFFYPLNLTNPNASYAEHPRLVAATDSQLANIREHVERMTPKQRQKQVVGTDWQGITDMIVARYADRLAFMATVDSVGAMNRSLGHLLDTYIDYLEEGTDFADAQRKCEAHYLAGAIPVTPEEKLIYAGISGTMKDICNILFKAREAVIQNPNPDDSSLEKALSLVRTLMDKLRWSKWKECGACKVDEFCFIAMWPFGNTEDHYSPSCQNATTAFGRISYWWRDWWYTNITESQWQVALHIMAPSLATEHLVLS